MTARGTRRCPPRACASLSDLVDEIILQAVPPARLREAGGTAGIPAGPCIPGAAVEIEWQGSWYPGTVLEGPNADGTCYITYAGYSTQWDEWVTPDRLRPPQ